MRYLFLALLMGLLSPLSAAPLPENTDLLAQNTVLARYIGKKVIPCRFRTTDCPDRCGHAVSVAVFEVLANEGYAKPGKYGDDKMEPGAVISVSDKKDLPGEPAEVREALQKLAVGETVRMTVTHYYLKSERVCSPVRPVTALEVVAPAAPDEPAPEMPADPDEGIMPLPLRECAPCAR